MCLAQLVTNGYYGLLTVANGGPKVTENGLKLVVRQPRAHNGILDIPGYWILDANIRYWILHTNTRYWMPASDDRSGKPDQDVIAGKNCALYIREK